MKNLKSFLLITIVLVAFVLSVLHVAAQTPPAPAGGYVVATGTFGNNGASKAFSDFAAFIMPNPSNGLFNASEFDLAVLGTVSHRDAVNKAGKAVTKRDFGADVSLAYWFTTGLGSRFDIQYANGQATYTSLSGVARTTFGTTNNVFMISPYTVAGAAHGVGDDTAQFNGFMGLGVEIPFSIPIGNNKKIHSRAKAEVDFADKGKPTYLFGFEFAWQR